MARFLYNPYFSRLRLYATLSKKQGGVAMVSSPPQARRIFIVAMLTAVAGIAPIVATGDGPNWAMIGNDPANSRNQPQEHRIGPGNVNHLAPKWIATTAGDVSGTPAVVNGVVYFGDFGGMLWALDADTGAVIWSRLVSDYTGIIGDIARTSPSVAGNTLVVGDLRAPNMLGKAAPCPVTATSSRRCIRILTAS